MDIMTTAALVSITNLDVPLFVCFFVYLPAHLFGCLSVCFSGYWRFCLSTCLSVCLPGELLAHVYVSVPVYSFACDKGNITLYVSVGGSCACVYKPAK